MIDDDRAASLQPFTAPVLPNPGTFLVSIEPEAGRRTIHVSGELDLSTCGVMHGACVVDDGHDVTVDLRSITFMDCGGYGGLLAARRELENRGGSLFLSGSIGQPARFLALLAAHECSPLAGSPADTGAEGSATTG